MRTIKNVNINKFLIAEGYLENLSWAEVKLEAQKRLEAKGFKIDKYNGLHFEGYYTEIQMECYAPWADPECPQYKEYLCFNFGRRKRHDSRFVCFVDFFNCHTGMWETKENLSPSQEKLIIDTMKGIYDDLYMDRKECCAYEGWRPFLAD